MTQQKHLLGVLPKRDGKTIQKGALDQFVIHVDPILGAEEAVLQFFALTNQPFEMIESKAFQNIYRSIGTTCPIASANVLRAHQEVRFNDIRQDIQAELDSTCKTFSISFDA
jgi:hypothetical protein